MAAEGQPETTQKPSVIRHGEFLAEVVVFGRDLQGQITGAGPGAARKNQPALPSEPAAGRPGARFRQRPLIVEQGFGEIGGRDDREGPDHEPEPAAVAGDLMIPVELEFETDIARSFKGK